MCVLAGFNHPLHGPTFSGPRLFFFTVQLAVWLPHNTVPHMPSSHFEARTQPLPPLLARLTTYTRQSVREFKRRKCNFCLGTFSIFLVVFVAAVATTILAKAPVIFVQQSEIANGQIDITLTPSAASPGWLINYTALTAQSSTTLGLDYTYSSPRWSMSAQAFPIGCTAAARAAQLSFSDPSWFYTGPPSANMSGQCGQIGDCMSMSVCRLTPPVASLKVSLIDTERESRMGLGRSWPYAALAPGQVLLSSDLAAKLGVQTGDTFFARVQLNDIDSPLLGSLLDDLLSLAPVSINSTNCTFNLSSTIDHQQLMSDQTPFASQKAQDKPARFSLASWLRPVLGDADSSSLMHHAVSVLDRWLTVPASSSLHWSDQVLHLSANDTETSLQSPLVSASRQRLAPSESNALHRAVHQLRSAVLRSSESPRAISEVQSLIGQLSQAASNCSSTVIDQLKKMSELWLAIARHSRIVAPLTVAGVMSDNFGKWSADEGSLMVMEQRNFLSFVAQNMPSALQTNEIRARLLAPNALMQFAPLVNINLPPSRVDKYLGEEFAVTQRNIIAFTSQLLWQLGFSQFACDVPTLAFLAGISFFSLFLGLIINVIVLILFLLSCILIYSLLIISVETRTFELGVFRMVGLTRRAMIEMLMLQAFGFALPAYVIGLLASQTAVGILLAYMEKVTGIPIEKGLVGSGVLAATILGLLIPCIAAILPIRDALSHNLHDALDTRHSKTKAVQFTVQRSDSSGGEFSTTALVLGGALFILGLMIYYLVPLSLLSMNLGLFFDIFFGILIGMLFGLTLLALNLESMMERLLVSLILFWERQEIRVLIVKNLIAHRARNRKTTIMYALSLGFILFITTAYDNQIASASFRTLQTRGSYVMVQASVYGISISANARNIIEQQVVPAFPDLISNVGWISQRLVTSAGSPYAQEQVTGVGHYYSGFVKVWAISPSLFDSTIDDFLIPYETEQLSALSVSKQLYTAAGSQGVLLGRYFKDLLQLKLNPGTTQPSAAENSVLLALSAVAGTSLPIIVRKKPLAFIDLAPAFKMTQFPADRVTSAQDALVDFHSYIALSSGKYTSVEDIPMYKCVIQLKDGASTKDMAAVSNILSQALMLEAVNVWDFSRTSNGLQKTTAVMNVVFSVATYIAMGLCFFSLVASMFTNIWEQSKEIGILRAVGMTQSQIIRLYVHEAFILVLSASLFGLLIGTCLGWTMSAQQQLFTQFPVSFTFPIALLVTIIGASIFFAALSSFGPARELNKKPIAAVMRTVL